MNLKRIIGSHFANYRESYEANRLIAKGLIHPTRVQGLPARPRPARPRWTCTRNSHQGKIGVLALAPREGLGVTNPEKRAQHLDGDQPVPRQVTDARAPGEPRRPRSVSTVLRSGCVPVRFDAWLQSPIPPRRCRLRGGPPGLRPGSGRAPICAGWTRRSRSWPPTGTPPLDQSAQLARELDEARARTERLRVQVRNLVSPPQSVQGMSERMRSMLRLAEDEAGEMLAQAEQEADQLRAEAPRPRPNGWWPPRSRTQAAAPCRGAGCGTAIGAGDRPGPRRARRRDRRGAGAAHRRPDRRGAATSHLVDGIGVAGARSIEEDFTIAMNRRRSEALAALLAERERLELEVEDAGGRRGAGSCRTRARPGRSAGRGGAGADRRPTRSPPTRNRRTRELIQIRGRIVEQLGGARAALDELIEGLEPVRDETDPDGAIGVSAADPVAAVGAAPPADADSGSTAVISATQDDRPDEPSARPTTDSGPPAARPPASVPPARPAPPAAATPNPSSPVRGGRPAQPRRPTRPVPAPIPGPAARTGSARPAPPRPAANPTAATAPAAPAPRPRARFPPRHRLARRGRPAPSPARTGGGDRRPRPGGRPSIPHQPTHHRPPPTRVPRRPRTPTPAGIRPGTPSPHPARARRARPGRAPIRRPTGRCPAVAATGRSRHECPAVGRPRTATDRTERPAPQRRVRPDPGGAGPTSTRRASAGGPRPSRTRRRPDHHVRRSGRDELVTARTPVGLGRGRAGHTAHQPVAVGSPLGARDAGRRQPRRRRPVAAAASSHDDHRPCRGRRPNGTTAPTARRSPGTSHRPRDHSPSSPAAARSARPARTLVSCTGSSCDKSGDPGGAWQGAARSSYRVYPPGRQRRQGSAGRRNYCANFRWQDTRTAAGRRTPRRAARRSRRPRTGSRGPRPACGPAA